MYLKCIEIQGFKSFANKIRLEFHNGFTAIVGPNGSGKSNVADAVRWVLGEQRVKQLRGGSMQDVIFAGTEIRKPLSSAYVAITLDNSDHRLAVSYEEVTVARRLYRSGESEYLINGAQVRLRDVQELFYDTGIGKEGYSIIGQGQIEKILSDKPEDRRELFDEAVGIVKFKRRKAESVKKLQNGEANLVRVTDILSELDKQVGPLEKQAEQAKIYLKTREELKTLDVNVFLLENAELTVRMKDAAAALQTAQEDMEKAGSQFEESRTAYEQVQKELEELEKTIETARARISNASITRGKLEGDIKLYEAQIRSGESNAAHFKNREETVAAQLAQKQEELDQVEIGRENIGDEMEELRASSEEASAELEKIQAQLQSLTDSVDGARERIMEILSGRSTIKSRLAMLQTKKEQLEIRKAELSSRIISASTEEAEHDRMLESLRGAFEAAAQEAERLSGKERETERAIAERKTQLGQTDEKLRSAERDYHQEKSKLDALKNLTERYEGFGNSVKRVMEYKDREPGLVGVVADLIKTEPKYENAIEVALGGSIQNIVTEDEATARRMIDMLKREKAGRATFLPLTSIGNSQTFNMMGALKERGVIGLADTLVRVAPQYRSVAASLLGRILVVDNFDNASAVGRKYSHRIRMVTLEGELFNPGGSISGGAFRNNSNLLGRRREIADLEKASAKLKESMEAFSAKIVEIKQERNVLRTQLEEVRSSQQELFLKQNTIRLNIAAEEEKKQESSGSYESLRDEQSEIETTRISLEQEEAGIREDLLSSEKEEEQLNALITKSQEEIGGLKSQEEEKAAAAAKWELEIQKKKQLLVFEQQEFDRIREEVERLTGELSEIRESIRTGEADISEKKHLIEETEKTIEASHEEQSDGQSLLNASNERRSELGSLQKKYLEDRERLSEEKARLDKEVYRLTSQKERLEEQLESQINYMWSEYEITLTQAEELRDESMTDLPGMKKKAGILRGRIRSLGNVNVGAIEEYRELMERYTFLKQQHTDIVEAQKSLEKIIKELDEAMRRQFRTQFAKIQAEFDKVFKELFGGGSGKLELVEGEDILEAGVRVIAQPPGKKLQNMMQMSGGEKSLSAIALLFAIQNLKPSPFCLLDEIEAALDESNVGRFAGYLHKLTKDTQFIVITHRRGTMDRADRLYGITMQEKGVSTLVSVSLIDEKDLAS